VAVQCSLDGKQMSLSGCGQQKMLIIKIIQIIKSSLFWQMADG